MKINKPEIMRSVNDTGVAFSNKQLDAVRNSIGYHLDHMEMYDPKDAIETQGFVMDSGPNEGKWTCGDGHDARSTHRMKIIDIEPIDTDDSGDTAEDIICENEGAPQSDDALDLDRELERLHISLRATEDSCQKGIFIEMIQRIHKLMLSPRIEIDANAFKRDL